MTPADDAHVPLLVVEDEAGFLRWLTLELPNHGFEVTTAETASSALEAAKGEDYGVVLLDLKLPDGDGIDVLEALRGEDPAPQVVVLTGHGSVDVAVRAMKAGAGDFLTKPCQLDELSLALHKAAERGKLHRRYQSLSRLVRRAATSLQIIGESEAVQSMLGWVERAAPSNAPVLILGESGTGKELIAHAIHQASPRRDQPFVAINCAAMPHELLESELFGHVRGAFTGAHRDRFGLLEDASTGTLLLDEIGDMPPELQAKMLRVLEIGEYRRVGENKVRASRARVVAATNRDLRAEVNAGRFRQDLYFRLNVLEVTAPPLRERTADIPLLAQHFLERFSAGRPDRPRRFTAGALDMLRTHDWRGNVRELENLVERVSILCREPEITMGVLSANLVPELTLAGVAGPHPGLDPDDGQPDVRPLRDIEREHILAALDANRGNKLKTARDLGIDPKTLYKRLRDYGLFPGN